MDELTAINLAPWRCRFIIAVLAAAAYAPTLRVGFLWDDHILIERNATLREWSWQNLQHDFLSDNSQGLGDNYYRPVQAIAHRFDYSLWGLNAFGYHLLDLLLHIGNGWMIYQLMVVLGLTPMAALMAGSLFAVNPIGIEMFLVASGLPTQLNLFFSLACLLFLCSEGTLCAALGLLCGALAAFSKESGAILPGLLALVYTAVEPPRRRWWVLLPLTLLSALYILMRRFAVHQTIGPLDVPLLLLFVVKVFPRILWHYVGLILVPWNLHSHRLIPRLSPFWPLALAGLAAVGGWLLWKRNRLGILCLGWMVLTLLPTIPIMMRGGFMLDHWGYPMAFGLVAPLAWALTQGWGSGRRIVRDLSGLAFFGIVIVWSLLVHLNVTLRGTDEKMYRWALHFTTSNPIKYNLAALLLETDRPEEAVAYLQDYLADYPDDLAAGNALAQAYWKSGNAWLAAHMLQELVRVHPDDAPTRRHLALVERALRHPS